MEVLISFEKYAFAVKAFLSYFYEVICAAGCLRVEYGAALRFS